MLVNAHFFPFLSRKKKKEVGERKKKKDRGQAPACREYGNILRKQDIRGDTGDVCINFTVSPVANSLKTRSHKQASGFIEQTATAKACRRFRLFVRKVSALPKRKLRGGYPFMFAQSTWYPCTLLLKRGTHTFFEEKIPNFSMTSMPLRC